MISFLSVIGLILIIEGFPYFCFPDKVKEFTVTIQNTPSGSLRTIGLILMLLGLGIVFLSERVLTVF